MRPEHVDADKGYVAMLESLLDEIKNVALCAELLCKQSSISDICQEKLG